MSMGSLLRGGALLVVLLAATAGAQTSRTPSPDLPNIERYYERPFDVPSFVLAWEKTGRLGADGVLGFLAAIFANEPEQIARVSTLPLAKPAQTIVIQALRFAQKSDEARALAQRWNWPPREQANIAPVRPLLATRPEQPSHFNTFWGASFAAGDAAYIRPIYDYYAGALAEPDIGVDQVVGMVLARIRGDREAAEAIARNYPRERVRWVVFGASALWSLDANARQHRFVAEAIAQFVRETPEGLAVKGLRMLRSALREPSQNGAH